MVTGVQQLLMLQSQTPIGFVDEEARIPLTTKDDELYPSRQSVLSISTKNGSRTFYRGVLGSVNLRRRRKFVRSLAEPCPGDGKLSSECVIVTIQPSFLQCSFDMTFVAGTRFIPRTLNVYHTLSGQEPIFDYVCHGNLSALQMALQDGIASPFITDECGRTLLHVRSRAKRSDSIDHCANCN